LRHHCQRRVAALGSYSTKIRYPVLSRVVRDRRGAGRSGRTVRLGAHPWRQADDSLPRARYIALGGLRTGLRPVARSHDRRCDDRVLRNSALAGMGPGGSGLPTGPSHQRASSTMDEGRQGSQRRVPPPDADAQGDSADGRGVVESALAVPPAGRSGLVGASSRADMSRTVRGIGRRPVLDHAYYGVVVLAGSVILRRVEASAFVGVARTARGAAAASESPDFDGGGLRACVADRLVLLRFGWSAGRGSGSGSRHGSDPLE
jgi:hypothetical protein